jgi:hypothetical protein
LNCDRHYRNAELRVIDSIELIFIRVMASDSVVFFAVA